MTTVYFDKVAAIGRNKAAQEAAQKEKELRTQLLGQGFTRNTSFLETGLAGVYAEFTLGVNNASLQAEQANHQVQFKQTQADISNLITQESIAAELEKQRIDQDTKAQQTAIEYRKKALTQQAEMNAELQLQSMRANIDSALEVIKKTGGVEVDIIRMLGDLRTEVDKTAAETSGKRALDLEKLETKYRSLREKLGWDRSTMLFKAETNLQATVDKSKARIDASTLVSKERIRSEESKLPVKLNAINTRTQAEFEAASTVFKSRLQALSDETNVKIDLSQQKLNMQGLVANLDAQSKQRILNAGLHAKTTATEISTQGEKDAAAFENEAKYRALDIAFAGESRLLDLKVNAKNIEINTKLNAKLNELDSELNSELKLITEKNKLEQSLVNGLNLARYQSARDKADNDIKFTRDEVQASLLNKQRLNDERFSSFVSLTNAELVSTQLRSEADYNKDREISSNKLAQDKRLLDTELTGKVLEIEADQNALTMRIDARSKSENIRALAGMKADVTKAIANANDTLADAITNAQIKIMVAETQRHLAVTNQTQWTKHVTYK